MLRPLAAAAFGLSMLSASVASADGYMGYTPASQPTLNFYGLPGLIDMPTAGAMPDGTLAFSVAHFADTTRITLAFQVLPRVTATFRYAAINGYSPDLNAGGMNIDPAAGIYYYDRSFDLHWQAIEESGWLPAVAIGIRDIAGTGVYGGEYVVATRHFGANDQVAVTAGIGWGRLGERDGFTNPLGIIDERFETRPPINVGQGGTFSFDQFFRGDAALFGGIEWQASDRLRFQMEYSSDTYRGEVEDNVLTIDSPFNFGATYQASPSTRLGAYYLYGNTFGVSINFQLNPNRPVSPTLLGTAPVPVAPRPMQAAAYSTEWVSQPDGPAILRDNLQLLLGEVDLDLVSLHLDERRAVIRLRNTRYGFESQALGRAMRVLTATMPHSVEVFEVIFVVAGVDVSRVRVNRGDVETFEHDPNGAAGLLGAAQVEDARVVRDPELIQIMEPQRRLMWSITPYAEASLFDPETPVRADFGVQAEARLEFGGGWVATGRVRARLAGDLDGTRQVDGPTPNGPPPVRTNAYLYNQQGGNRIENLTLAHYGRPAPNLYSRVTVGYLERMFAGVSAELLWQPVDFRIGLGVEVNHVWQRDFDGGLGLQDYDVTMGHVSAYIDLGDDFEAQVDAGRYLGGDWGATLRLERVFNNGWRVGAFATFTDVSFDDFGEGSFDKGITVEIPLSFGVGTTSRASNAFTLRPVLRDGGATLGVDGRLHELVTDYHQPRLEDTRGMIWR